MAEPDILTPESERALVERARGGDEEAFGTLMRTYYEPTFRLVASIVRDAHAARDVCQEVWLTVWKQLETFRGDAKFSTWIHPIAVRRAIDQLRSRKRWRDRFLPFAVAGDSDDESPGAPEPASPTETPREELERRESTARFERAIESLPPKHRAVLALREIQGLSYDKIATAVGINRGTVMSRLFNARRMLAQKLKEMS